MIRAIDRSSVQKICSGQVVVDLATAVKEMVENSLDAGATTVEVRLADMGAQSIEVSDNGFGIDPKNYSGVAMKHFTSKLSSFEDLYAVSSFGFRGEALNALCELSEKFTVVTKQDSQTSATLLQFDRNGRLVSETVAARTTGTTVTVEKLFEKLPVRRNEFVKSIKKHFQKMVKVVQSYALIAKGVKILVTNSNGSEPKQTVFTTQSGGKLLDNVSILYGAKFAASLLPIELAVQLQVKKGNEPDAIEEEGEYTDDNMNTDKGIGEEDSPNCVSFGAYRESAPQPSSSKSDPASDALTTIAATASSHAADHADTAPAMIGISGLVSKVGLGVGRSDNDRQFTFVNGRPVDLPRFAKVLNEVWRRYEMKQKPAFVLDISVPAGYFDVNLTPDKREVLIVQEARVLEKLRECVDALYQPARQTMQLNQGMGESKLLTAVWPAVPTPATQATGQDAAAMEAGGEVEGRVAVDAIVVAPVASPQPVWASKEDRAQLLWSPERSQAVAVRPLPSSNIITSAQSSGHKRSRNGDEEEDQRDSSGASDSTQISATLSSSRGQYPAVPTQVSVTSTQSPAPVTTTAPAESVPPPFVRRKLAWKIKEATFLTTSSRPLGAPSAADRVEDTLTSTEVEDRAQARVLNKKDFPRMRVLGQFNLGFIIAELDGDLYILDQHACDEKYRFELLQRTTQLHQQPLLRPLPVETSAALELVIAEHAEIFVQNGFKIAVDLTAAPGQRVQLQSVPFSKTVQFGVDDVNELASMISERTGSSDHIFDTIGMDERMSKTYLSLKNDAVGSARSGNDAAQGSAGSSSRGTPRLPKLVAMYASRACRSAIMIGTALKQAEMEGVVHRLQGVEQPWNCPHGRPTLRHLVDLVGLREHKRRKLSAGMGTEMS